MRSPGSTIVCIFLQTLTSSRLAFDRESEAITSPSRMKMPKQYVIFHSVPNNWIVAISRDHCRNPHLDFYSQNNQ